MIKRVARLEAAQMGFGVAALATIVLVLALRLVDLDRLPGEIYGDIVIIYDYVARILDGQWPVNFDLSAGPLYQYLITPLVGITGLNYLGLKVASVEVSLLVLAATYALGRELEHDWLALLGVFVAGVSSWLLVFSRLGNSQILVPLLTAAASFYALRASASGRWRDIVLCALVSALGLYTYPQNFILPGISFLTLLALMWLGPGVRWRQLGLFAAVSLVLRDPANFFTGYIGEKLPGGGQLGLLLGNLWKATLALHVRGDINFRSNPTLQPQLDIVSGLLMLAGCAFWLQRERWRRSPALFVPLLLIPVPSLLVRYPIQVPSASRTLGAVPMISLLVASGLWWALDSLRRLRWAVVPLLLLTLAVITGLNMQRYFQAYADGLPNHNTPFGRVIADYIDSLPPQTTVYVRGCCWGQWEQPQRKGILYAHTGPQQVVLIDPSDITCPLLQQAPHPAVVIWSPGDAEFGRQLAACLGAPPPQTISSPRGGPVFQVVRLPAPP